MKIAANLLLLILSAAPALALEPAEGALQTANLGRCELDSGKFIEPCMLAYRTFGKLNAEGTNAIFFPTWYGGRSEDLLSSFGPDKLVDTTRYFGVAIDAFGNGVSSSPSNSTTQHGPAFPTITIRDMVRAEYRLATETLHLHHLHAVIGISMGGIQTFEWMADYPEFIDKAVPIVGTMQPASSDLLDWDLRRKLIIADPDFNGGNYTAQPALTLANEFSALMLPSPAYITRKVSRAEFPKFLADSLKDEGKRDANDRLLQLYAMITLDIPRGGSIAEVARKKPVSEFIAVAANDHLVNPTPALEWASAVHAQTYVSSGDCGHLIFECDGPALTAAIREFLAAR